MHAALAHRIWTALGQQTVVVAGTAAVEAILPKQATALAGLLDQRTQIAFRSAGHLAAYVGLAPVTRGSGSSIKCEHPARGGNKRLKNALFPSAFAALHDPESRAYYDHKGAQGKKHNAAIVCPARRRTDVIYATLRDGTYYQAKTPAAA